MRLGHGGRVGEVELLVLDGGGRRRGVPGGRRATGAMGVPAGSPSFEVAILQAMVRPPTLVLDARTQEPPSAHDDQQVHGHLHEQASKEVGPRVDDIADAPELALTTAIR